MYLKRENWFAQVQPEKCVVSYIPNKARREESLNVDIIA